MTNAEAWFNIALRPRKPEGSLGRTAQDGHLDSHTAPELRVGGAQYYSVMFPKYVRATLLIVIPCRTWKEEALDDLP